MSVTTNDQVRGSAPLTPDSARWDWYGASVAERGEVMRDVLRVALGADDVRECGGRQGYAVRWELRRDDSRIAEVLAGGHNPGCYVLGTSDDAPGVAAVLRGEVTGTAPVRHGVSRADVAVDVDQPGAWERLEPVLRALGVQSGLRLQLWQDPERPELGRTLYVGSPRSRAYVRLYEKGKKDDPSRPNWVRFEVEIKPGDRAAKERLALLSPLDALGTSRWVRSFVAEQFAMAAAAAPARADRVGDGERAMAALVNQYGRVLAERAAAEGGWEALGRVLGRKIGAQG